MGLPLWQSSSKGKSHLCSPQAGGSPCGVATSVLFLPAFKLSSKQTQTTCLPPFVTKGWEQMYKGNATKQVESEIKCNRALPKVNLERQTQYPLWEVRFLTKEKAGDPSRLDLRRRLVSDFMGSCHGQVRCCGQGAMPQRERSHWEERCRRIRHYTYLKFNGFIHKLGTQLWGTLVKFPDGVAGREIMTRIG